MAKTGQAVAKLTEKAKRMAMVSRLGSCRAVVTRHNSSHHDKVVALEYHKRLIQDHAINLGCRVTDVSKDGTKRAVTFRGDGLADDSLGGVRVAKTAAEKAAEDKRAPLKDEMVQGWKPQRHEPKFMRFVRK